MANFVPSALVNGQATFLEGFQSAEWRVPDNAAIAMIQKGGVATPQLAALRTREDRAVYAYMPIRQAATDGTARAHNHTGARGDSLSKQITWTTFSEPFSISLKQAGNNVENWESMYASTKRNAVLNLIARLDAWLVAQMVAGKTGYNVGGGKGVFNETDDVYEVDATELSYFFQNCKQMMYMNEYNGQLLAITDDLGGLYAERLNAQGSGNAINYGFQFGGVEVMKTTRTVLGTDYDGSALFFEQGMVGVIPWIPKENRKPLNFERGTTYMGDRGSFMVPELGFDIATHMYADRANTSGSNGSTQDDVYYEELSVDMGFIDAQLSAFRGSNDAVIYGCGQLS